MTPASNCSSGSLRRVAALGLAAALFGCAAAPPNGVSERLDERTGTTLTALREPMELVSTAPRGSGADPFAFLAPFETNTMGRRAVYLWVAVPNEARAEVRTQILVDGGSVLALGPQKDNPSDTGLAAIPYAPPTPWSAVQVFELPPEALRALATTRSVRIVGSFSAGGQTSQASFDGDVAPADLFSRFRDALGL